MKGEKQPANRMCFSTAIQFLMLLTSGHENRLVFLHTGETSFLNLLDIHTYFPLLFFLSLFLSCSVCGLCMCVCGYENKSPLCQVMCLFSWAHLLVYCVVAFLPSYRLALTGHFSPSNPVHHILVLESVK